MYLLCFFFSSRRRHTRFDCDWSSDVCSSDLEIILFQQARKETLREVLGIFAGVTVPPDVGVKWIPIGAAQFLQGLRGLRRSEERRVGKECRSRWSRWLEESKEHEESLLIDII